jgi:hypothetical protein
MRKLFPLDVSLIKFLPVSVAGITPDLMAEINREATRRMASLVAPLNGPHEEALRLSMGLLFEQIIRKMEAGKSHDRPLLVLYR